MKANKINPQIHKKVANNNSKQTINKNNVPTKKNVYSKRVVSSKLNTKEDKSMQIVKKEANNDVKNKMISNKTIGDEGYKEAYSMSIKGHNNQGNNNEILNKNIEFKYSKKIPVAKKNVIEKGKKIINNQKIEHQTKNKVNNNEILNTKKNIDLKGKNVKIDKEKKNIRKNDIKKEIKNKNDIKINVKNDNILQAQQDNENINEINSVKSMEELSKPGLIGLLNIGAVCYMNATLQCFSNCSRFKYNLLKLYKELESNKDSKYKLSFSLVEVLKNLWEILHHKNYSPDNFKNTISELNPIFKNKSSKEPKDLVLFMIQKMHTELNKPNPDIKTNNICDSHDFLSEYNSFMSFYKSQNNSIITDEFHFYVNNMTICSKCQSTIHNVQTSNFLLFPLEEVRKFKNHNDNCVSIYDCFEYNERQTSSDSFYCNDCKDDSIAYSMTKIVLSPKTLIIIPDRGYRMEYPIKFEFEEYLNIRKFIYMKESPYYYELTGIICYSNSNDDGGHFVAFCKNYYNCNWYKFDDESINKCSFSDICQDGMHCLLFYSYIQMED